MVAVFFFFFLCVCVCVYVCMCVFQFSMVFRLAKGIVPDVIICCLPIANKEDLSWLI